jgi:hypothetical protein
MKVHFRSAWVKAGVALPVIGASPLLVIIIAADLGL